MKDSLHIINDSSIMLTDSITRSESVKRAFIQEDTPLHPHELADALFSSNTPDWLFLTFIGTIVYLILIKFLLNIHIVNGIRGLLKIEVLDDVSFEKTNRSFALFLAPLALIVYAYYIYFLLNRQYLNFDFDNLFGVLSLGIFLLFALKQIIAFIIATIFNTHKAFYSYLLDYLYILGIGSLIQLVFIVLYSYSSVPLFLWFSFGILIIFFIYRLIRSLIIGLQLTPFSKSYLFLYLCSLEILPIIWIIKWVLNYS